MQKYARIEIGETAPVFRQKSTSNEDFNFDTAAGRYILLGLFGSSSVDGGMLDFVTRNRDLFDDRKLSFFGVTIDVEDERQERLRASLPGIRYFWDFDGKVSRQYGAAPLGVVDGAVAYQRRWVLLDPDLRIRAVVAVREDGGEGPQLARLMADLPALDAYSGLQVQAPVLVLANVFEPELCARLVRIYEAEGGTDSGFMRQSGDKTVHVTDHGHKRRSDVMVTDADMTALLRDRIRRRIAPVIRKVHQFEVTRMERYLIGCYDSETGGHFGAHRDNTTSGTAHRRFAVSINLNEDFEGGEVSFPEYGQRSYKPVPGGAVVFSCSLLHAVSQVRRGKRYAFLPFLYDDAAAALREQNRHTLVDVPEAAANGTVAAQA